MLKATGHYLLAISALTTQTERATRLPQEDAASVSASVYDFYMLEVNCCRVGKKKRSSAVLKTKHYANTQQQDTLRDVLVFNAGEPKL